MLALVVSALAFSGSAFKPAQMAKAGAAAAAIAVTAPAFAGDIASGESVFQGNCAACHAGGQNSVQPEKTLELASLKSYLSGFDGSEKAIVNQVTNGKNAMPAFGGRLEEDEIEDVAAYVLNQAKNGW